MKVQTEILPSPGAAPSAHVCLLAFLCIFCMSCPAIAESPQDLITKRLEYFSKSFIGRPYLASPLGEGRGIDADPLLRYDAFDCTTYVETVIASALAETDADIVNLLNRIRYTNGRIDFASRRHLPEFQ